MLDPSCHRYSGKVPMTGVVVGNPDSGSLELWTTDSVIESLPEIFLWTTKSRSSYRNPFGGLVDGPRGGGTTPLLFLESSRGGTHRFNRKVQGLSVDRRED